MVHYFQPKKNKSKQWKHPESPVPKKVKSVTSAGKVMVFRDAKGVLLVESPDKGSDYYRGLLH